MGVRQLERVFRPNESKVRPVYFKNTDRKYDSDEKPVERAIFDMGIELLDTSSFARFMR